jgi:hypothetical protein
MKSPFGEVWAFSSNQPDTVSDSAYTAEALGPHHDGTYFARSPGFVTYSTFSENFVCILRWNGVHGQGGQMVYFQTQNPILCKFWRVFE